MKAKELYSEKERKVIENQFLNYFLKNLYYRKIDYYNKKNKISKTKGILTEDIEKEYLQNSLEDNILCQSYYIIDTELIENTELYKILSEFSELEMKVLNLLVVNGNTQQEIAKYLNISQPRVSAIKKKHF